MMTELQTVFIYALKDPRDGAVRYIGKTETPQGRLRAHLRSKPGSYKAHWICQLKDLELAPSMEILDEVPESQWEFFERAYIKVYKESGANLTNMTPGGDVCGPLFAGHRHSEDSKRRIGEKAKGRGLGVPKTPECRAKLSAALKGRPMSPENRAARIGIQAGEKNPNFGKKFSPERCAAISASKIGKKQSPEVVAARITRNTGKKRTPEQRARMSAGMKGIKIGRPWTEKQRASFEKRKAAKSV